MLTNNTRIEKQLGFWLIFASVLLCYPLIWPRLLYGRFVLYSDVVLCSSSSVALLAVGLLLINVKDLSAFFASPNRLLFPGFPFAFIFFIALLQPYQFNYYSFAYFFNSVCLIFLPLISAVLYRQFYKNIPWLFVVLGFITVLQSFHDMRSTGMLYGICGNWNWNATLLAVAIPFVWLVFKYFAKRYSKTLAFKIESILLFLPVGYLILRCQSKATFIAIIFGILFLAICRIWNKIPKRFWLWGMPVVLLILIGIAFKYNQSLIDFLRKDTRIYLWEGVIDVIFRNLWVGTTPSLFESKYAQFIPDEYYLNYFATDRNTHPHNHLLYIAATMGLPALLAWISLIAFAIFKNIRYASVRGHLAVKLYLFAFIVLLVHSMFDVILDSWPAKYLFLLLLGILLGNALKGREDKRLQVNKLVVKFIILLGVVLIVISFYCASKTLVSTGCYRKALLAKTEGNYEEALSYLDKSIQLAPSPQNIYLAALVSFFDCKNPQAALRYLYLLPQRTGFVNYINNNGLTARALVVIGKAEEAVSYFENETANNPLSVLNTYYYWQTLRYIKRGKEAKLLFDRLNIILRLKGLDFNDIPFMIKNPGIDSGGVALHKYLAEKRRRGN
jgi:tetratricopeptide (TPR) repeat protein